MSDPLKALSEVMARSRTVGFVGAGYSIRSGFPAWTQLLKELHKQIERDGGTAPEPEKVPDKRWLAEIYAQEVAGKSSLQDALRRAFEQYQADQRPNVQETAELDRMQMLVARLPFNHFITTNYDSLLEQACNTVFEQLNGRKPLESEKCISRDGRVDSQFSDFLGSIADTRRSVLHLHGRLEGDELTLSMGAYDQQYLHDAMLLRMFSIFATCTVVFLGSSMEDTDMMELLRRSAFHTGGRRRHYALLPRTNELYDDMLRGTFGVEPIFYDATEDDHSDLDLRLERLLELVERGRRDEVERAMGRLHAVGEEREGGAAAAARLIRTGHEAAGNTRPVRVDHDDRFDVEVERVKDEIRRMPEGPARFRLSAELGIPSGGIAGSRVLRRIATDYRELPRTYWFRHVVWISPGRIGLFPVDDHYADDRPRGVVDAVIGEVIHSLGRHRATATADRQQNTASIKQILGNTRWDRHSEPALIVIDGIRDLLHGADEEADDLESLLYALPAASVAIYERPTATPDLAGNRAAQEFDPEPTTAAVHDLPADETEDGEAALPEWATFGWTQKLVALIDRSRRRTSDDDFESTSSNVAEEPIDDQDDVAGPTHSGEPDQRAALQELQVLIGLCVVATPIRSDELTTILEFDKHNVDKALRGLGAAGLIELTQQPDDRAAPLVGLLERDLPDPKSRTVGILNPIRTETLRQMSGEQATLNVVARILQWAAGTVARLRDWENDNAQLNELTTKLPNLLAAFEAGCWICDSSKDQSPPDSNRHLWLGTDLSYILYTVGRWAEAESMLAYLSGPKRLKRPSERYVFEREVLIRQSEFYGFGGRCESDYDKAIDLANRVIRSAKQHPTKPGAPNGYAPRRLTSKQQEKRARVRRAEAAIRRLADAEDDEIRATLHSGEAGPGSAPPASDTRDLDDATPGEQPTDGAEPCYSDIEAELEDISRGTPSTEEDHNRVIADATLALVELRLIQKRIGRGHDVRSVLVELDRGRMASQGVHFRPRGYNALLRGQVLLDYHTEEAPRDERDGTGSASPESDGSQQGATERCEQPAAFDNTIAARRCFARALLISHEFKDRYLEAAARLGLAQCDQRRSLAQHAANIFDDLRRPDEWAIASRLGAEPAFSDRPDSPPHAYPKFVVIVGIPGSGKTTAAAAASTALGEWGFNPARPRFEPRLYERLRNTKKIDLSAVAVELQQELKRIADEAQSDDSIVIVKVPIVDLVKLLQVWPRRPEKIDDVLCIHLTTDEEHAARILMSRNDVRFEGIDPERVKEFADDAVKRTEDATNEYSTLETYSQCQGNSYVHIDFNLSALQLEARVRDVLALSYLSVEKLIDSSAHRFE